MKSFEDAVEFMKEWSKSDNRSFDGRDIGRFASFLPIEMLSEFGLEVTEEEARNTWIQREWSEKEVISQLIMDADFGYEKAYDERGISASCMFSVVNMWCFLLEN